MIKTKKVPLVYLILLTGLISCQKDKVQAESSIKGDWDITEIVSQYGSFVNNTFVENNTKREMGDLGTFNFAQYDVIYNFTRNDTLYTGNTAWNLAYERVNSGFVKVPKYTLTIENRFIFDAFFEDGTKNAEKNAKEMRLTQIPANGDQVVIELKLVKR